MNRQNDLLAIFKRAGLTPDWKWQGTVLSSQVGHYCRCAYHARTYPENEKALIADARRALGDLAVQIQLCCAMMHIDFEEVFMEGFLAFRDQMTDATRKRDEILEQKES